MKNHSFSKSLGVLLLSCCCAFAQNGGRGGAPGGAPSLDLGTVKDSLYVNKYFGLLLRIPNGWQVQDNEATRALMERGRSLAVGDDKNFDAAVRASEMRSLTLLTVFKYAPGSPVDLNPSIMCLAEKVNDLPGIQKGSDYLFHVRKGLSISKLAPAFDREIYEVPLAGYNFGVLEVRLPIGKGEVKQKYYATILKGYALSFIISYGSEEELRIQNEAIQTIKIQPPN